MNILKKVAIGVAATMLFPALVMAEGNLHAGPLEIHPILKATESYTNNVYSRPNAKKRDWYTTTIAGLRLDLPFREHLLDLGYQATFNRYAKYDEENSTTHVADGLLDLKLGSRFGLTLSDRYSKSFESRGETATGIQEHFETNAATVSVAYELVDVSEVRLDYTKTTWDYKNSTYRARDEDLAEAYIYLKFLPKTSAFIEVDGNNIDYNDSNSSQNSQEITGLLGLTWELSDSSIGTVQAGYMKKNFNDKAVRDFNTWVAFADINHDITESTRIVLDAHRKVSETTLVGSRYILNTRGSARLIHSFFTKFSVDIHASLSKDAFSDINTGATLVRKDSTSASGVGVNYDIQNWLTAGLGYEQRDRNSNVDTADYDENIYSVSLKFEL